MNEVSRCEQSGDVWSPKTYHVLSESCGDPKKVRLQGPEGEVMEDVTFHPSYHKCRGNEQQTMMQIDANQEPGRFQQCEFAQSQ